MSTFVPFFKRFWVKATLIILLLVALIVGGMYTAFYRLSDFEQLQKFSNKLMEGSKRTIHFDAQVERALFPRPTIILHKVTLSETDGRTPAVNIDQVNVGVSWRSLFGDWQVEKLTLDKVATIVSRDEKGVWNFADLLQNQNGNIRFNRIYVNNGNILIQAFGQRLQLNNIQYSQSRQSNGNYPYTFQAEASHNLWQKAVLNAQGYAMKDQQGSLHLPDLRMQFEGEERGGKFSGTMVSKASFVNGRFASDENKLIVRSDRFSSDTNVNIDRIIGENNYLLLNNINSVFTGQHNRHRFSGTLTTRQAKLDPSQLSSDEIIWNLSSKEEGKDSVNMNLKSPATWHAQQGFSLPKFQMSTRQDLPNGIPRYVSELTGSFNAPSERNWQAVVQGQFDRQPVAITLVREHNTVNGTFQLAKIDLANYMDQLEGNTDNPYPSWLSNELSVNMDIAVGTFSLPAIEINNIQTTLRANAQQAQFKPFSADLYGGHSEGTFAIVNQKPVQYILQQKAEGVQIRPMMQDLFRNSTISGKGDAEISFITTGANRQELTENLSGSLNINVADGYWHGINIRELMRVAAATGEENNTATLNISQNNAENGTPFDTFVFKSKIEQGVSRHSTNSHFTNPVVSMTAKGETNLYSGRMSEDVNILSNNGKDTLPLRITGTMDNPAISLNYQKITSGLKTTQQKTDAVTGALKKQWDWMREQNKGNNAKTPAKSTPKPTETKK